MSRQDLISFAQAAIQAYNDKDWDAVRETMHRSHVYDEVATGRRVESVDETIELWKGWGTAFPDSRATFLRALEDGTRVVLELEWTGTHRGSLQMPGREIPPTGKSIRLRACEIIEMEGEKAKSSVHYFDIATLLRQIGVDELAPAAMAGSQAGTR